MGLFSEETQEEKDYKKLIRVINSSRLPYDGQRQLVAYVSAVHNKERNNDFFEYEFLERVILNLIQENYTDGIEVSNTFDKVIDLVKFLLPQGLETPDYGPIKEMIINNFVNASNDIKEDVLDKKLYALFNDRIDYLQLVRMIFEDPVLLENYALIIDYACNISPYCVNSRVLKSEIVSFMHGMNNEMGDLEEFEQKRITEVKKRVGIYPIGEQTLSLISSEAEKAQALVEKLDAMHDHIDTYQSKLTTMTEEGTKVVKQSIKEGKKEISDYAKGAVSTLKQEVKKAQEDITQKLDAYLIELQQNLKVSSDQVFNQLLEDAQAKIRDIRLATRTMQTTTTSELLRVQEAANSSMDKIKDYLSSDENLKKLLKSVDQEEQIKDILSRLNDLQKQTVTITPTSEETVEASAAYQQKIKEENQNTVYLPGSSRLIVPMGPNVIVPKSGVVKGFLPAFDPSIPFHQRYEKIMEEKKQRMEKGELFHELTDEVLRCVMEGDWVYLWGPSGCGKSYLMEQTAELLGIDYVDNGKITNTYSVMGYNDPHGRYRATPAFVSVAYGKMLGLDEFDNGNSDTQVVLNGLYSGLLKTLNDPNKPHYTTFGEDMTVTMNPNFRMISAGNTNGEGENEEFSARAKLDEAVLERMTPIRFTYDNQVEKRIFREYDSWYQLFINFRKACDSWAKVQGKDSAAGIGTTRDAEAIAKYISNNSKSVDEIMRQKFIQTKDVDYLSHLEREFRKFYDITGSIGELKEPSNLAGASEKYLAKKFILNCQKGRKQEQSR